MTAVKSESIKFVKLQSFYDATKAPNRKINYSY